jgi:hypothetical protein
MTTATATTKCSACHLKALTGNKYCQHHKQALDNLKNHYKAWVNAYGGISWEEFLSKLAGMQETGRWIKEVIGVELKK